MYDDVVLCSYDKSQLTFVNTGRNEELKEDKTKETKVVHIQLWDIVYDSMKALCFWKKVGRVYDKIYFGFCTHGGWLERVETFSLCIWDLCMYVVVYVYEIRSCNHIWCYHLLMPFNVISCFLVIMDICIMVVCGNLMQCAFCA